MRWVTIVSKPQTGLESLPRALSPLPFMRYSFYPSKKLVSDLGIEPGLEAGGEIFGETSPFHNYEYQAVI